jgi:hypothetical protein
VKRRIRRHRNEDSPAQPLNLSTSQPSRRGRPRIQDEFTHRTDLTAQQKYQLRHLCDSRSHDRLPGIGTQKARVTRTDLGLALLQRRAIPGVPLTLDDIAAWAGITRQGVDNIYKSALRKLRNNLFFRDHSACAELRSAFTDERRPARPSTSALRIPNSEFV